MHEICTRSRHRNGADAYQIVIPILRPLLTIDITCYALTVNEMYYLRYTKLKDTGTQHQERHKKPCEIETVFIILSSDLK